MKPKRNKTAQFMMLEIPKSVVSTTEERTGRKPIIALQDSVDTDKLSEQEDISHE